MSSSPVAVAASDPGVYGEPKQELRPRVVDAAGATAGDGEGSLSGSSGPAGDADVTMMEAVEVAPVVAEVKMEGKAVAAAGDAAVTAGVVREGGGAAAASDPLYATESAGMVSEEEFDGAGGLDGGDGGEEKLEAEAGGLQSVAERKPVPAGDGAAAGEAVEAPGSATTERAEAESNNLEENRVSATPAIGNKEKDNGVAHCDKEIHVLSDVDRSSKIHEDDGVPTLEQQDDKSKMLPPTWEQVLDSGNYQHSNDAASPANVDQCARYCLPPLDKGGFRVSDLVWGKVKSHPWWPGEIFYPSDASELALKHQKKGNHLVAYFGDNTFAWCDESQLKPFVTNYSQMEKQNSSDAFVSSVNYALEELSRRILLGTSCSCLPEELSDNGMSYMVENAGLKDGVTCSAINRSEILTCFSPGNLLHYIKSLALFPGQGGDLLELVIACSQLTSFYRSKGCPELASFQTSSAWVEIGMDTSSTWNVVEEAVTNEVHPSHDKPKRGRGRPREQKPDDDLELMDKKATSNLSNDTAYDDPVERHMVMDFDDFDDLQNKKKKSLDSFEDSETKSSTPTFGSSFKIGECIRRAANQLTGSSSIVKSQNEPTVYKNSAEAENGEFDISSDDAVNELTIEKRAKRRRMHRHHIADPKELLSQLCSVAMEPMNGYSFSAMIINYFSDYRNYIVSTTTEANIVEKSTAKRGRKRKVLPSPEVETTDHMQDSYWSGLSLHNHPIHSLRGASTNTRPRRRCRASRETNVPSVQHLQLGTLGPKKQIQVIERSIIHVDEKMVDECKPTALVLSFGRSTALPSETDLIKMFGHYGPLKESETEVHKNTNTVKVAFKKRADAEKAFSAAGKYGTFGPSLRSYRLVTMPFSLGLSEVNNPESHPDDHGLQIPGPCESEVPLDAMQVDQVNKADIAEAIKESSAEQVETVKQTFQAEAADKALVDQVDIVEKTRQIDAELTGRPDQIGTAAIAEESSEQASTVEQAYAQDEASLKDRSEIALSRALTGASNGGTVDEIQLGEAPNQTSVEVPSNTLQMEAASEAQTEDTIKHASHTEATNEESAEVLSDTIQVDAVAEAPKQGHACGDNAVYEAVAEASIIAQVDTVEQTVQEASAEVLASTMQAVIVPEPLQGVHILSDALHFKVQTEEAVQVVGVIEQAREEPLNEASKDVTEADSGNEVPEKTSVSQELQAQSFTEKPGEQDASEQTMQFQAPKEESAEVPCDAKLEVEAVTAEPVGQVATEQVKVPLEESTTVLPDAVPAETSEVQGQSEVVQFQAVCEASVEQEGKNVEADTVEDLTKASAEEAGSNKQIVESETAAEVSAEQVCSVERTVRVEAVTEASGGEIEAGKQIAEDVAMADATTDHSVMVEGAVESNVDASGGEIEAGKQIAEDVAMADATTDHSVMVEGAVESKVDAPVDETLENKAAAETLAGETAEGEITAEAPDETMGYKATAEALSVETGESETTADVPDEDEKINNKATVEALETAEGETTAEAPDQETTTAEKTVEDTTTTAEKTVEDATVETQDEKTTTAEKAVEDATVEGRDEKTTAAERDATVEARDGQAGVAERTG